MPPTRTIIYRTGSRTPLVCIGMPTYNAERTIGQSIEGVLGQSLTDLELVISDNASTDHTWDIVMAYATRDRRITSIRQEANIGANGNYSAVFRGARSRYFKWASSNDWCSPDFVVRCVDVLEEHADTVIVAPRTKLFESSLESAVEYNGDIAFNQDEAVDRFIAVGRSLALNNVLNGVIRTAALRQTRLVEHYPGADIVLIGQLALLGKIGLLDEHLFYRRMDRTTATRMMNSDEVHRHHYPAPTARSLFPAWRMVAGWLRAVLSSELPLAERLEALRWVARTTYWSMPDLRRDLVDALSPQVRR